MSEAEATAKTASNPFGADIWYTNCGSFEVHGLYGSTEDLVTSLYLRCGELSGFAPTLIRTSLDVFESIVRLRGRFFGADNGLLREAAKRIVDSSVVTRQEAENLTHLLTKLSAKSEYDPTKLYGATVEWTKDIPYGTMLFYRGELLLAEMHGWVP